MRVVTADEIDSALTFPALVDALSTGFAEGASSPERHHHVLPGGPVHLLMPGWSVDAPGPGTFLGTKIVNVFPDNAAKGLPAVLGIYILFSGETGQPLAMMDGTRLTHWRTAAASALAARHLARADARHLLMVGAGALAPFLVRAHASVRPIDTVSVWNRSRAGADRLVASLVAQGIRAEVADDLEGAVRAADVVSCATLSSTPLVLGAWLRPGTHLDLVGAFSTAMREADDEALRRGRVFVDTEAALTEGGDVAAALRASILAPDDIAATLYDLCGGTARGRGLADEITVFKSVGTALEDLAAASLLWRLVGSEA